MLTVTGTKFSYLVNFSSSKELRMPLKTVIVGSACFEPLGFSFTGVVRAFM